MTDAATALPESASRLVTEDGEVIDLDVERARLTKERADKVEMEDEQLREELIRWADVKRMTETLGGAADTRLGAPPAEVAPVVRPDDPVEARRILELAIEEVREAPCCTDRSGWRRGAGSRRGAAPP